MIPYNIPMSDDVLIYSLLCGSALLAGMVNAIAGGGTLLTFPALMYALSGNGVLANGTSTVALMPGSLAGSWGYRAELASQRALLRLLLLPSLIGGAIGALLVTRFPASVFNALVPWLILLAALLFLIQRPVQRWLGAHRHEGPPSSRTTATVVFSQLLIGIYGGYFGAGIGILMLSTLAFMAAGNIHHLNAVKTVLAAAMNGVAVLVFIAEGKVRWDYAAAMAFAAIIGGYIGARVARKLRPSVVRGIVIAIGFGLAGYYFWKQFS